MYTPETARQYLERTEVPYGQSQNRLLHCLPCRHDMASSGWLKCFGHFSFLSVSQDSTQLVHAMFEIWKGYKIPFFAEPTVYRCSCDSEI